MDPNLQFFIIVGSVVGAFVWLRNDIYRVSDGLNGRIDGLEAKLEKLSADYTELRSNLSLIRGRLNMPEKASPEPTE